MFVKLQLLLYEMLNTISWNQRKTYRIFMSACHRILFLTMVTSINLDSKLSNTFQNLLLTFNITADCNESFYLINNNKKT
jgi:hypothetical protein